MSYDTNQLEALTLRCVRCKQPYHVTRATAQQIAAYVCVACRRAK